jgi:hypothetical protein
VGQNEGPSVDGTDYLRTQPRKRESPHCAPCELQIKTTNNTSGLTRRLDHVIGTVLKVKFMDFDSLLARAKQGTSAIQTFSQTPAAATEQSEPKADIDKISIPREELENAMLAELQQTVACADVREVAVFGAAGLRSGATWIVASFLPGSSNAEHNLETVRRVEKTLQCKYDMTLGS